MVGNEYSHVHPYHAQSCLLRIVGTIRVILESHTCTKCWLNNVSIADNRKYLMQIQCPHPPQTKIWGFSPHSQENKEFTPIFPDAPTPNLPILYIFLYWLYVGVTSTISWPPFFDFSYEYNTEISNKHECCYKYDCFKCIHICYNGLAVL